MKTYCGANCNECAFKGKCAGCETSSGSPFGGKCVAAEYVKLGGLTAYGEFREQLKNEINGLLKMLGVPETEALFELAGAFVNMEYVLPNGEKAKLLKDENVYLGTQVALADTGRCCGVAADTGVIVISSYGENGSDPELLLYKKR